jgi:hypothetical protein
MRSGVIWRLGDLAIEFASARLNSIAKSKIAQPPKRLPAAHRIRRDEDRRDGVLLHPTRFLEMTGYLPGRGWGQYTEWQRPGGAPIVAHAQR